MRSILAGNKVLTCPVGDNGSFSGCHYVFLNLSMGEENKIKGRKEEGAKVQ